MYLLKFMKWQQKVKYELKSCCYLRDMGDEFFLKFKQMRD
ncbi:hypothetical protein J699_02245 [Acinetobacter sp. 1000160]|nr:hypothetical protein ACINWC323_3389 [Acinetobacter sp. WC-323]EXB26969.1 hypothetical protein J537_1679 [Acinetobacter baumannii 1437282]EXB48142.1 hypothetical protein J522_1696 [Acinetobacter baumannii 146457]EYT19712.1 hypothetical protein J699_02245 [Acinetobacter sp. 1000160]